MLHKYVAFQQAKKHTTRTAQGDGMRLGRTTREIHDFDALEIRQLGTFQTARLIQKVQPLQ